MSMSNKKRKLKKLRAKINWQLEIASNRIKKLSKESKDGRFKDSKWIFDNADQ